MGLLMWLLIAGGSIGFWGIVLYLAFRFVRATERRPLGRAELDELRARVAQLEGDLEATRSETERLAAAESHMMMLLSRRSESGERIP
ncbi:MAG: hypothetical protein ABI601_19190 [bacterium]